MLGSGGRAIGVCVFGLGVVACSEERPAVVPAIDEAADAGRALDQPPAPAPTGLPLLDGFAPGSVCQTTAGDRWCWYNAQPAGDGWLTAGSAGPRDMWVASANHTLRFDGRTWT